MNQEENKMTEKSTFDKNMELWEKFVNTNMDLMFKTMEKTMEGSKSFHEQMTKAVDRAVDESRSIQDRVAETINKALEGSQALQEQVNKAVNTAMSAQLDATTKVLQSLERQVQTLSEKVDELVESQTEE
jgi:hypothetical protein